MNNTDFVNCAEKVMSYIIENPIDGLIHAM